MSASSCARRPTWLQPSPTSQVTSTVSSVQRQPAWLQPAPTSQLASSPSSVQRRAPMWSQPAAEVAGHGTGSSSQPSRVPCPSRRTPVWLQPAAAGQAASAQRSWTQPSPSGQLQGGPPKRQRVGLASSEAHEHNQDRHIHLDMVTVLMATDEADQLTSYARHGMDRNRVEEVLQKPCRCGSTSHCRAITLPLSSLMEFLQRWHHLSDECKTHLLATSYETCGPQEDNKAINNNYICKCGFNRC
jgi:hypothetical protein